MRSYTKVERAFMEAWVCAVIAVVLAHDGQRGWEFIFMATSLVFVAFGLFKIE